VVSCLAPAQHRISPSGAVAARSVIEILVQPYGSLETPPEQKPRGIREREHAVRPCPGVLLKLGAYRKHERLAAPVKVSLRLPGESLEHSKSVAHCILTHQYRVLPASHLPEERIDAEPATSRTVQQLPIPHPAPRGQSSVYTK